MTNYLSPAAVADDPAVVWALWRAAHDAGTLTPELSLALERRADELERGAPSWMTQVAARFAEDLILEGTAAHWRRRARTFTGIGGDDNQRALNRARGRACQNIAVWITHHGTDPRALNAAERWVFEQFIDQWWWTPAELDSRWETVTELISRHRRVLSQVEDHRGRPALTEAA